MDRAPPWLGALRDERLPAVVVDLDAFDRNVRAVAEAVRAAGPLPVRVATKSVRVPELLRRIAAADPVYRGWMTYSAHETRALWEDGFDDFLLAYPAVGRDEIAALRAVHDGGGRVAAVVDGVDGLRALASGMEGVARPFRAVLDVDLSLRPLGGAVHAGVRRSPLRSLDDVRSLYAAATSLRAVTVCGFMGYDAQLAGLQDASPYHPVMNVAARAVRALSRRSVPTRRRAVAELLRGLGCPLEIANGGGSGSIDHAPREPWLTEVTAGSAFLAPHLFDYFRNVRFEAASWIARRAARASDAGFVTCAGGGYPASGAAGPDKLLLPVWPRGARLVDAEGGGEVQTPVMLAPGTSVAIGDPVLFRHAKAGEAAERFASYLLVASDRLVGSAPTYRGRGWCFG